MPKTRNLKTKKKQRTVHTQSWPNMLVLWIQRYFFFLFEVLNNLSEFSQSVEHRFLLFILMTQYEMTKQINILKEKETSLHFSAIGRNNKKKIVTLYYYYFIMGF